MTNHSEDLREKLLETINYIRFEQEWNAMSHIAANHRMSDHEIECKVCRKMYTLNNESIDAILSTIIDSLPENESTAEKEKTVKALIGLGHTSKEAWQYVLGRDMGITECKAILEKARER